MPDDQPKKFAYFVDGERFETDVPVVSGAFLRAKLPTAKRDFGLYVEGAGGSPDQWVDQATKVSLEGESGPRRFFTAPQAMFG